MGYVTEGAPTSPAGTLPLLPSGRTAARHAVLGSRPFGGSDDNGSRPVARQEQGDSLVCMGLKLSLGK